MAMINILNGPNLNLLGQREPEIYGRETLADIERLCAAQAQGHGLSTRFMQSNAEHVLIDRIHAARGEAAAIVINPAAFTHTSVALRDALAMFEGPIVEVHLSNIHAREPFRHHSYIAPIASAVIAGCGSDGYLFAIDRVARLIRAR